jgi:hypothetical protein
MAAVARNVPSIYGSVPKAWPGSTIVCIGGGPSLTRADVEYCRGRARVIAIKDAIQLAPWADVLYGCGADRGGVFQHTWWYEFGDSLASFQGMRFTLDLQATKWATVLMSTGPDGLELHPQGLRTGQNSGYQAINLAVHLGAAKIVLLGYDMRRGKAKNDHWFGPHPKRSELPYQLFLERFPSIVEPLRELGVEVINATRETALDVFTKMTLAEALA